MKAILFATLLVLSQVAFGQIIEKNIHWTDFARIENTPNWVKSQSDSVWFFQANNPYEFQRMGLQQIRIHSTEIPNYSYFLYFRFQELSIFEFTDRNLDLWKKLEEPSEQEIYVDDPLDLANYKYQVLWRKEAFDVLSRYYSDGTYIVVVLYR